MCYCHGMILQTTTVNNNHSNDIAVGSMKRYNGITIWGKMCDGLPIYCTLPCRCIGMMFCCGGSSHGHHTIPPHRQYQHHVPNFMKSTLKKPYRTWVVPSSSIMIPIRSQTTMDRIHHTRYQNRPMYDYKPYATCRDHSSCWFYRHVGSCIGTAVNNNSNIIAVLPVVAIPTTKYLPPPRPRNTIPHH